MRARNDIAHTSASRRWWRSVQPSRRGSGQWVCCLHRRWFTWYNADARECAQGESKQVKRIKQGAKRGFDRVMHADVEIEQDAAKITCAFARSPQKV
eukprot:1496081-Pleurochrysis_carterae.AAC.1